LILSFIEPFSFWKVQNAELKLKIVATHRHVEFSYLTKSFGGGWVLRGCVGIRLTQAAMRMLFGVSRGARDKDDHNVKEAQLLWDD
jgi:hypothetical protein